MHSRLVSSSSDRTYVLILDEGDEVISCLTAFAREHSLSASRFTAIGAFSEVTLGYFVLQKREYDRIEISEQVEVLALLGDVAVDASGKDITVHAHVVIGKHDATAHGGHLLGATVRPTLEVVLVESPAHLRRVHNPELGLALIQLDATL